MILKERSGNNLQDWALALLARIALLATVVAASSNVWGGSGVHVNEECASGSLQLFSSYLAAIQANNKTTSFFNVKHLANGRIVDAEAPIEWKVRVIGESLEEMDRLVRGVSKIHSVYTECRGSSTMAIFRVTNANRDVQGEFMSVFFIDNLITEISFQKSSKATIGTELPNKNFVPWQQFEEIR